MWIKLFGALGILASAWLAGKGLSDSLRVRKESLTDFGTALVLLEAEMTYANNSIDRAFLNISKSVSLNGFFEEISGQVLLTGARGAWNNELKRKKKELCLTDGDIQILSVLSAELGVSNTENQVKGIRHCREMLRIAQEEATERFKTLSGLYRKVCFGGGLMLLILFI